MIASLATSTDAVIFAFDDYELDADRRTLTHKGELVRVEGKPLELLTYLVENRGRLVTKQELKEVIWGGAAVSRSTLPITVYAARKAIGQDQGRGGPVATVGRQGYRFTGDITFAGAAAENRATPGNPFVGRAEIVDELTKLLSQSRTGQGHVGLLTGEAGIGKSRTARELATVARGFGISAWTGHSTEGGGAPAFWTWQPIIRATLDTLSERQLATLLKGGLPPELDRLFPELAVTHPRHPRLPAMSGAAAHHRVHEALVRLIVGTPSTRARLIILEDLQWADTASLELLLQLCTRVADARLFVIGTLREPDVTPSDPRYEILHQVFRAPTCHRIELPPLTSADVAQFVARLTKESCSSETAAAIYEKTQGNPFFVEEMVRWLQSEKAGSSSSTGRQTRPSQLPVPDAVKVVIRRRLRMTSPPTQELLAIAAVIGEAFDTALLQDLAGGEPSERMSQLEEATTARLLGPMHHGAAVTRFAHVLIREAIYQDLPAAQRASIHLRIAEVLERQAGPDPDRFLNPLAFHYYRSLPAAAEKAFDYCLRAGRVAHSVFASEQACALYERALETWAFQEESRRDHVRRCVALLGLAHCSLPTRRAPDARPLIADAIRLARATGRPDLLALGVILANVYAAAGYPTVDSIREVTEEALALLPEGLPSVRAYLLSRVASDGAIPVEKRRALAIQAMDLVSSPEDRGRFDDLLRPDLALMRAEAVRFCMGSLGPEDLGLCLQLATRVMRLAKQGDLLLLWVAHRCRAKVQLTLGDVAAAAEDVKTSCFLAERAHAPLLHYENLLIEGYRAQMEGRFDDAQREIDRLADAVWPIVPAHRDFLRRLRTLLLRAERGVATPEDGEQDFLNRVPTNLIRIHQFSRSSAGAIVCRLLLSGGRRELSLSTFQTLVEGGLDTIPRDDFFLATMCDLAFVCCEFDDKERAAELYDRLKPYASLCAVEIPLHFVGPVAHYLGLLASTLGNDAASIEHFEAAAAVSARVGARPLLNRTYLELATLLLKRKDAASRARAVFLIEEGLASARELGMTSITVAFGRLLHRLAGAAS
jgi:DNA-binding winged helix-turn-helix (wHTH) protein